MPRGTAAPASAGFAGKLTFEADIWNVDRFEDPDLDAILRTAERLIYRFSAGKLGQP